MPDVEVGLNVYDGGADDQRFGDRRIGAAGVRRQHLDVPRRGHIARLERHEVEPVRVRPADRLAKAIEHGSLGRVKELAPSYPSVSANVKRIRGKFCFSAHPREFAKSKNPRRCDVSRLLHRARSDLKMSMSVDFMSMSVDFRSMLVDFRAHPVDFLPGLSASANRMTIDVTHILTSIYSKIPRLASAIRDQKGAF